MKNIGESSPVYDFNLNDSQILVKALDYGANEPVDGLTYREVHRIFWLERQAQDSFEHAKHLTVPHEMLGDKVVRHLTKRLERYAAHLAVAPSTDIALSTEIDGELAGELATELSSHLVSGPNDPFHMASDLI